MAEPETIECDHCGCEAVESPDGMFTEDMASACMTCGFPGRVALEEAGYEDDDGETIFTAYWRTSWDDEARCNQATCTDCPVLVSETATNGRKAKDGE